jgi:replication-associated recombination protein RarA
MKQLLVDELRPTTINDIVVDEQVLDPIVAWANLWANMLPSPESPGILFIGHPGTGKTTMAKALASDMGWNLIETNASDARSNSKISSISVGQTDLFGRLTCLLFDEVDSMHGKDDKGGGAAIAEMVAEARIPIILTANNKYKVSKKIMNKCTVVQFRRPSVSALKTYLFTIIRDRGMVVSPTVVTAAAATQDYRLGLAMIEANTVYYQLPREGWAEAEAKKAMKGESWNLEEVTSLIYNIEENAFRNMGFTDTMRTYDILSRSDMYRRRRESHFSKQIIKRLPKLIGEEEISFVKPIFFQKKKDKEKKEENNAGN